MAIPSRVCPNCQKRFFKKDNTSKLRWSTRFRHCSISCARTGKPAGTKSHVAWNKGLKGYCPEDKHSRWLGEKAGYRAKHNWVVKHFGQSMKCERCGFSTENPHQIHWANLSGKYKRVREDWSRLCVKCHYWLDHGGNVDWKTTN